MNTKSRYFKLRYKLIMFYIMICLIPIVSLGSYITVIVSRNSIDQSIRIYSQATQQLRQNLVNELQSYYSIGYDIAYDPRVIEYLNEYAANDLWLYDFYINYIKELTDKARYKAAHIRIRIYTPNTHLKISGMFIRDRELYEEKLSSLRNFNSLVLWNGITKVNDINYLSFLMPITDYNFTQKPIGVLEISIDLEDLQSIVSKGKRDENIVLVLDDKSQPIISNVQVDKELISLTQIKNKKEVAYRGAGYYITRESVENPKMNLHGWTICNLIPLNYVYQNKRDILNASGSIIALCVFISVPLLVLFSRHITGRVEFLIARMNDVKEGNYQIPVIVKGKDEINQLSHQFETMLREIDRLMQQVYKAQLKEQILENEQKEAQLLALQGQINPHYLFNTMETIRMNLLLKGDSETSEIVRIFADSFRIMIESASNTISLHEEIEFICKYFQVQKYRYEDKINLALDIACSLPDYRIPKFMLQPLIENAIYHGLELKDGNGTINLSIRHDDKLIIMVRDDGIGMTKEDLRALIESIRSDVKDRHNYAMRNIFKRLKLLYGADADFEIDSVAGEGTFVRLSIPLDQLKEGL